VPALQREDRGATASARAAGERERAQRLRHALHGEVEHGGGAARGEGGLVVGERGGLGGVEGAEPHAGAPARGVADLGRELAPRPLAHPDEGRGRRLPLLASRRPGDDAVVRRVQRPTPLVVVYRLGGRRREPVVGAALVVGRGKNGGELL